MSSTKFLFFGLIEKKNKLAARPLIDWEIFDCSSEAADRNSTKLDRKQDLNVIYQVCVFQADQKKPDGRHDFWLAEAFSTSPLKLLNGIQRNLTRSKIPTSSTKFVFFGLIGKTRWPLRPLIGWDIFDISETADRNSAKLDRKQDLNVCYQVCVFQADRKNQMAIWSLIGWDIIDFSSEWNSTKLDRKQDPNILYRVCVFRADRKNKMAAPVSDWMRHYRFLLWNHWTEFNLTNWKQELNFLYEVFFGPIRKTRWPPLSQIGWDLFYFYYETAEGNSAKLDMKQNLKVLRCTICGTLVLLFIFHNS